MVVVLYNSTFVQQGLCPENDDYKRANEDGNHVLDVKHYSDRAIKLCWDFQDFSRYNQITVQSQCGFSHCEIIKKSIKS